MVIMGASKFSSSQKILPHCFIMSPSQNINAATIAPVAINPESIPMDSDPEQDLKEIQHEVVAKQAQIEKAGQARSAAAQEHIEKKWKVKEEEAQKVEEAWKAEEVWKVEETWKEEEDKVVREKAWKRQLEVRLSTSLFFFLFFFEN